MNGGKLKLLLVDDNEMIRIFFRDVFWLHGLDDKFELTLADGIEQAAAIIKDPVKVPDAIFLDMNMPMKLEDGRTVTTPQAGLSILRLVKQTPELSKIKVYVFSGNTEKSIVEEAKKLGADNFLAKEEHLPQDLIKVLEDLFSQTNSPFSA